MKKDRYCSLMEYCEKMRISYSYKPVLILGLIQNQGSITLDEAASFFLQFYSTRQGLIAEIKNSIYSNLNCTFEQVKQNIKNNPIKALLSSSDCFVFNFDTETLSFEPIILDTITENQFSTLHAICLSRLDRYYSSVTSAERRGFVTFQKPQDKYGFLCNDYCTSFSVSGTHYTSMMQFMAHRKALLIGDEALGRRILTAHNYEISSLRDEESQSALSAWKRQRQIVAYKGLLAKFVQNDDLLAALLDTGSATIVACLPDDPVWGNGLPVSDSRVNEIEAWKGENLLGYTLMQVRSALFNMRTI